MDHILPKILIASCSRNVVFNQKKTISQREKSEFKENSY